MHACASWRVNATLFHFGCFQGQHRALWEAILGTGIGLGYALARTLGPITGARVFVTIVLCFEVLV